MLGRRPLPTSSIPKAQRCGGGARRREHLGVRGGDNSADPAMDPLLPRSLATRTVALALNTTLGWLRLGDYTAPGGCCVEVARHAGTGCLPAFISRRHRRRQYATGLRQVQLGDTLFCEHLVQVGWWRAWTELGAAYGPVSGGLRGQVEGVLQGFAASRANRAENSPA